MCPLFSLSLSLSLYIEEPPVPHWRVRHLLTTHFCLLSLSILLVHTITTPCSWKLSSSDHMRLARPNKSTLFQTPIINALETLIHLVWSILEHLSFSLFSQTMYGIKYKIFMASSPLSLISQHTPDRHHSSSFYRLWGRSFSDCHMWLWKPLHSFIASVDGSWFNKLDILPSSSCRNDSLRPSWIG